MKRRLGVIDSKTGARALLIFPPFVETALRGPHLGAGLLAGTLLEAGIEATVLDLNIRLVRALFAPETAEQICDAAMQSARPALSAREIGALVWFKRAAASGWIDQHPPTISYALRVIRRVLYPVPSRLEDCLDAPARRSIADDLYEELLKDALASNPSAIGISVAFSEQLNEALAIGRIVRNLSPRTPILFGGSQINLLQPSQIELLAGSGLIDEILTTNGELAIVDLVRSASRRESARVTTSRALSPPDLQDLPHPNFDEIGLYLRPLTIPVLATKGCYWGKCSFCDYVRLSDLGSARYLARPVAEVLNEIAAVERRFAPERIMLVSDAVPPGWYRQLATRAVELGIELKTWSYMMHHDHLDRAYFDLLATAGVAGINFGTESTNSRILRLMRKQASVDAIRRNLRDAHDCGLTVISNVIADYPTTTFDEAIEVVRDFEALAPHIDVLNPSLFDLTAGTPAAADPTCHGLNVPKSAYQRSSHGYHSLEFDGRVELTTEQRLVLRACYDRLAGAIRLRNRVNSASSRPVDDVDEVELDSGAFEVLSPKKSIKIPELGVSADLDAWEVDIYFDLASRNSHVPAGVLRSHSIQLGYKGDWVHRLAEAGLVRRVQPSDPIKRPPSELKDATIKRARAQQSCPRPVATAISQDDL